MLFFSAHTRVHAHTQVTLDCFHSIAKPGTAEPTADWYGAEGVVDAWLGEVATALRVHAARSLLPF